MEYCKRKLFEGQVIGDACPDCGHTNVVHPGEHNPVIDACVLCALESRLDALAKLTTGPADR